MLYQVDLCGGFGLEDIREHHTLESAKDSLYDVWVLNLGPDEEDVLTEAEIDNMDEEQTADALEGIGYMLTESYAEAKEIALEIEREAI